MKKIELLAPAGNMEALKAAVAGGCDAVYLGLSNFSARAFAGNFTHEEFEEAIAYCHVRNVSIYVTINTMMFEKEIENAVKEIRFLYEHDVDAVLIQDLGLFHYVRTCFPDLAVHCSTQMHVHNTDGAEFMTKMGAERVVVARETPLSVIRDITSRGIETEVFAYGALCISYSGQCLFSSALKNRSGNRGMCAQMCRLKYWPENGEQTDGEYLLSPRDLNVIDRIPELIEAGVASLKIEGRMKRPEYVYLVVKTFREAIDAAYAGKNYTVSKKRLKELMLMFNRGFTEGHLFNADNAERMSHYRPNHMGLTIGTVEFSRNGKVQIRLSDHLYQHDGLRILNEPIDIGITAVRIYKNGLLVNEAHPGDIIQLDYNGKPYPKKGQKLQKTSDSHLLEQIRQEISTMEKTSPVDISYTAVPGNPLKITVRDQDGHSVQAESKVNVEPAKKAPLSKERIEDALSKLGSVPYHTGRIGGFTDNAFLPVSVLNETRREAVEKLSELRRIRYTRKGELPYSFVPAEKTLPETRLIVEDGHEAVEENGILYVSSGEGTIGSRRYPVIAENGYSEEVLKDGVISEVGAFNHPLEHVIAGMTLNIANSYAAAFVMNMPGVEGVILSSEMNDMMIEDLQEAYRSRYGRPMPFYRLVYGRRPMMFIKKGFHTNTDGYEAIVDLHQERFALKEENGVVRMLENRPYRTSNEQTYGSYVILVDVPLNREKEIIEEAYEEVFRRI